MKKTILVVRSFDKFSETLCRQGLQVINFETIKTVPLENLSDLAKGIEKLENYAGIFLTSPKAAEIFLSEFGKDRKDYRGKIYILGRRTRTIFENTSFQIVFREEANTAEEFIKSFDKVEFSGKKLLFLRGDKSLRTIPELLNNISKIDEIIVYRTLENPSDDKLTDEIKAKISRGEIDWICFFSPSGIENFIKKCGKSALGALKIAVIGTTTAKKVAAENLKTDFISPKANAEDFADGLIFHIKNIE